MINIKHNFFNIHSCRVCGDTDLSNFYFHIDTRVRTNKKYYKKDCKSCLNKIRAHRWATDEKFRKRQRKRKNTESYKKVARKKHFENRDKILKQQKNWYYNNGGKEQAKEYQKEYHKLPYVKAARLQREIVYRVLYQIGTKKEKHSHEYLNYTAKDLRLHIESLFKPGMNWENNGCGKGKWQLDHKKEVAQFIQEGIEDPNIINALSNLQPLWTEEHARKTGKFMRSFSKKF